MIDRANVAAVIDIDTFSNYYPDQLVSSLTNALKEQGIIHVYLYDSRISERNDWFAWSSYSKRVRDIKTNAEANGLTVHAFMTPYDVVYSVSEQARHNFLKACEEEKIDNPNNIKKEQGEYLRGVIASNDEIKKLVEGEKLNLASRQGMMICEWSCLEKSQMDKDFIAKLKNALLIVRALESARGMTPTALMLQHFIQHYESDFDCHLVFSAECGERYGYAPILKKSDKVSLVNIKNTARYDQSTINKSINAHLQKVEEQKQAIQKQQRAKEQKEKAGAAKGRLTDNVATVPNVVSSPSNNAVTLSSVPMNNSHDNGYHDVIQSSGSLSAEDLLNIRERLSEEKKRLRGIRSVFSKKLIQNRVELLTRLEERLQNALQDNSLWTLEMGDLISGCLKETPSKQRVTFGDVAKTHRHFFSRWFSKKPTNFSNFLENSLLSATNQQDILKRLKEEEKRLRGIRSIFSKKLIQDRIALLTVLRKKLDAMMEQGDAPVDLSCINVTRENLERIIRECLEEVPSGQRTFGDAAKTHRHFFSRWFSKESTNFHHFINNLIKKYGNKRISITTIREECDAQELRNEIVTATTQIEELQNNQDGVVETQVLNTAQPNQKLNNEASASRFFGRKSSSKKSDDSFNNVAASGFSARKKSM
jgi:hypothetical protein